jgi:glycosyltransferase involved in cell wall biosynthesis
MSPDWKPEFPFRFFFTNASAISGVSTTICANYHEKLKGKEIIYIPPLIPFEKSPLSRHEALEKLGYDAKSRVILYVGSLKPMKNPDRILEAFSRLGIDYIKANNIRLLFAGGGPMAADLKKNAQTIGLAEYIRLDGVIGRDAIPTYYQAATCYIISSDYEGTSISLLEAMFNRLPIIGSDAPGINSMIEHGRSGLLYKTEDAANLADQIRNILDNGSRATQLGVEAFNSYQTSYSYENMLRQYKKMFSTAFESGISN